MLLKDIEGLKYPDEFLVRWFFKNGLDKNPGKVLDLGCGNGNNSMLFFQYDWNVVGCDTNFELIKQAIRNCHNVREESELEQQWTLYTKDMKGLIEFFSNLMIEKFDSLILASSIYYLTPTKICSLLKSIQKQDILHSNADIYVRIRTTKDYRFGRGREVEKNCWKQLDDNTNEEDQEITFFKDAEEFLNMFQKYILVKDVTVLELNFDNVINDKIIHNSELVIWMKTL